MDHRCLNLVYICLSLVCRRLNWIYLCLILVYLCLNLVYLCLNLVYLNLNLVYLCLPIERHQQYPTGDNPTRPAPTDPDEGGLGAAAPQGYQKIMLNLSQKKNTLYIQKPSVASYVSYKAKNWCIQRNGSCCFTWDLPKRHASQADMSYNQNKFQKNV